MPPAKPVEFPRPPAGVWQGEATAADASAFLAGVERWRAGALERLAADPPVDEQLTPAMVRLLRGALGAQGGGADALPARVRPLPGLSRSPDAALAEARAVLLWRAALIDFLSDVWDVVGTPAHDLPECAAAQRWLATSVPAGQSPDERDLCHLCLEPLEPRADGSGFIVHDDRCPALQALALPPGAPPSPFSRPGRT